MAISIIVSGTPVMPLEAISLCMKVLYHMKVAEPCKAEDLVDRLRDRDVDVVVMAPTLGSLTDITTRAAQDIKDARSNARLVVISYQVDASEARAAMESGAQGMVSVGEGLERLKNAIVSVNNHEYYISPRIGSKAVQMPNGQERPIGKREEEILDLVAHGYSNQQIADELYLSVRTVESHRSNLNRKLGFKDRRDLVSYAIKEGILT